MRLVVPLVAVLMFAVLASAQSPDAPAWSLDDTVLYASNQDGSDELEGWVNTVQGDGNDVAMGPSGSCATHTGNDIDFTLLPPETPIDRTYVLPLRPEQPGTATLSGPVRAIVHIGAGTCYGEVDLTARLVSGGVTVAEGSTTGHRYNDASGAYPEAAFDMAVLQSTFSTDGMRFEIHVTGNTGGALFMGVSDGRGHTRFETDPEAIQGAPQPQVVYQDVEGTLGTNLTFANATSDRFVYNWTVTANSTFIYDVSPSSGNATLVLRHGGEELVNATIEAATREEVAVPQGEAVVDLSFSAFTGSALLAGAQPSGGGDETPTTPGTSPEGAPEGNGTEGPEDEDSPLPLAVVLGALVLVARRRRR